MFVESICTRMPRQTKPILIVRQGEMLLKVFYTYIETIARRMWFFVRTLRTCAELADHSVMFVTCNLFDQRYCYCFCLFLLRNQNKCHQ